MPIRRYSTTLQAVYSELMDQLQIAELEELFQQEGFFSRRKRHNRYYWYYRRRVGEKHEDRYVGAETPQLLERIRQWKARAREAKGAAGSRRQLIRQLRAGGYSAPDRRTGRVLEELARAGVFRLDGVLVGTHAFRCYPALLGARLDTELMTTRDVDIAQDTAVSLAVTETADPALGEALARADRFLEIPALDSRQPSTSWQSQDRELRVDLLTPLLGRARGGAVELPSLGAFAKPLRFLDFLLAE
ncbi:MAG TPA: GSU2403 family nucleotidyltransferase fold protein, partial [Gammaproteobacteria bacterium]|nr:GSU2403 family nucleotidyltransferase fold protein [Gammaproteobacteria bacterium]